MPPSYFLRSALDAPRASWCILKQIPTFQDRTPSLPDTQPDSALNLNLDPLWLEVRQVLRLRGPNIWTNHPVLEAWVDLRDMKETASDEVPGFNDRLMAWLPTMIEHRCSVGERGGFFDRLRRGTYPAHVLEHVTLELQSLAGTPAGFGKARATSEDGVYRVVFRYEVEEVAVSALHTARALLFAAYRDQPFDVPLAVDRLSEIVRRTRLDPGGRALVEAASERLITARRLGREGLIVLGHGARQRRVSASATDQTSAVAESIASDRGLAYDLLRNVGVPVPQNRRVQSAEEAWEEASDLGPPVVIKPRDSYGVAIFTNLTTREDVEKAYHSARQESSRVVVEKQVPGSTFRLLVIGGRVLAAVRRPSKPGEAPEDATERVHAEVAGRAWESVRVAGLDVAAVDVICEDVGQPLEAQGGVVLEVRARPDLREFLLASTERPRAVAEAILGHLYPEGRPARIPVVGVAGGPERVLVARLLVDALNRSGHRVGLAREGRAEFSGRVLPGRTPSAADAARALLLNPAVEALVAEVDRSGVLLDGLGFDRASVGVVTGLDPREDPTLFGFDDPDTLPRAERCVVDVVLPDGFSVLNADDARIASMAPKAQGRVVYYSREASLPLLADHLGSGERAVFLSKQGLVLAEGESRRLLLPDGLPPGLDPGVALAVSASAWCLGLPDEVISSVLREV